MNPYYDRILCVHRTHLVSNYILDFCFFIIHLSMDLKTLALSYRFQVVVFGLLCQDIPTLCYRVSLCSVGPLLRQAMVITCGLWGDLFHSSVFTPRILPVAAIGQNLRCRRLNASVPRTLATPPIFCFPSDSCSEALVAFLVYNIALLVYIVNSFPRILFFYVKFHCQHFVIDFSSPANYNYRQ